MVDVLHKQTAAKKYSLLYFDSVSYIHETGLYCLCCFFQSTGIAIAYCLRPHLQRGFDFC